MWALTGLTCNSISGQVNYGINYWHYPCFFLQLINEWHIAKPQLFIWYKVIPLTYWSFHSTLFMTLHKTAIPAFTFFSVLLEDHVINVRYWNMTWHTRMWMRGGLPCSHPRNAEKYVIGFLIYANARHLHFWLVSCETSGLYIHLADIYI